MSRVAEIVRVPPESAVNEEHGGVRAFAGGQTNLAELRSVLAVGDARISRGRRQLQDFLTHGGSAGSGGEKHSSSQAGHSSHTNGFHGNVRKPLVCFRPLRHTLSMDAEVCYRALKARD